MTLLDRSRHGGGFPNDSRKVKGFHGLSFIVFLAFASLTAVAERTFAAPEIDSEAIKYFESKVRPILAESCLKCHGPLKQKGGLRLDSRAAVLRGGESGAAVVPGRGEESLLVEAIHYDGLEMPPGGKLDEAKVAILTRWV